VSADVLEGARALIRDQLGLDFPARRDSDLVRALSAASDDPRALMETLRSEPLTDPAWRAMIGRLTVQESYFFRDAAFFAALTEHVLPTLIAARREAGNRRLALWSAGCADGQEPYSLAMLLDRLLPDLDAWDVTILGTDVNEDALDAARAGVFGDWALRELPAWARRHFRSAEPKRHELAERIRKMVRFAPLNLAMDPFPGSLDLVVCRNVLMYLTDDLRAAVLQRLGEALAPSGWLALSPLDSFPELEGRELEPELAFGVRLLRRRDGVEAAPPAAEPPRLGETRAGAREPADRTRGDASPSTAPSARDRARAAADQGNAEEAVALCLQALRDDPLDAEAHLLMAAVEEERGDLAAAIAALRRAIYTAPESATAHLRLGTLLMRRGDEVAARRSLTTAAELFGEHAPAQLLARVGP
jgi:chemotaxis protein methyltransferase CheR